MTQRRLLIRDLIVNGAFFLWFFSLAASMVYWAYKDMTAVYALFYMAGPFSAMWLVRRYCKRIWLFITLHMGIIAVVFTGLGFTPAAQMAVPFGGLFINFFILFSGVFLFTQTLYSFLMRFPARTPAYDLGTAVFFTVTLAFLCILCEYYRFVEMAKLLTLIVVVLLTLKFIFGQMFNIDYSMEIINQSASQPVSAILSFNNKLMAGFVMLALLAAVAANRFGLSGGLLALLQWLGRGLVVGLRFLFSLIGSAEPEEGEYEAYSADMSIMMQEYTGEPPNPTPLILVILEKLFIYAAFALTVVLVLGAILYACYRLYKLFYKPRENTVGDVAESLLPDWTDKLRRQFSFTQTGNSVRRQFYRKVRKHLQRGRLAIHPADTAWDLAAKIKASEDIDALTASYEQTRYND